MPPIVSFTLGAAMLFGMLVIGVDASYLFADKVGTRSAADLAALAGAMSFPDANAARTWARQIAGENGYQHGVDGVTVDVNIPPLYGPSAGLSNRIEVIINHPASTFFASVFAIYSVDVRGRAVAGVQAAAGRYAIYAGYSSCSSSNGLDTLTLSGSDGVVDGLIHSNGGVKISGQNNDLGPTTHQCSGHEYGVNTYANADGDPDMVPLEPYPLTLNPSDFTPTYCTFTVNGTFDIAVNGAWWQNYSQKILKPGVYCATGSSGFIKGIPQGTTGEVTFVAKNIEVSASDVTLRHHRNGVLFFSTDTTNSDVAIKVSGSNNDLTGIIYACPKPPYTETVGDSMHIFNCRSQIDMSGSDGLSADISIIGGRIKASGSDWDLEAFSGVGGAIPLPSLME